MRVAAWALAPMAVCHAASMGFMAASAIFGLDVRIAGAPEGLALVLPLCRGGTISTDILGNIDFGAASIRIVGMLAIAAVLAALSARACGSCLLRWHRDRSGVRRGPPRWPLF